MVRVCVDGRGLMYLSATDQGAIDHQVECEGHSDSIFVETDNKNDEWSTPLGTHKKSSVQESHPNGNFRKGNEYINNIDRGSDPTWKGSSLPSLRS